MSGILDLEARRQCEAAELEATLAPLRVREAQVWAEVGLQLQEAGILQVYFTLDDGKRYSIERGPKPRTRCSLSVNMGPSMFALVRGAPRVLQTASELSQSIRIGEALLAGTVQEWTPTVWYTPSVGPALPEPTGRWQIRARIARWWTRVLNVWKVLRG